MPDATITLEVQLRLDPRHTTRPSNVGLTLNQWAGRNAIDNTALARALGLHLVPIYYIEHVKVSTWS